MPPIVKFAVRTIFLFSTRRSVERKIVRMLDAYVDLAESLEIEEGKCFVRVPAMQGVDEEMRDWSFYQLLEHHVIVNKTITARIEELVSGMKNPVLDEFDVKCDVLPSASPGIEQVAAFQESICNHFTMLEKYKKLRGTRKTPHPLFGAFDAHYWNCMFAFHLKIHFKQAKFIAEEAIDSVPSD